jgi:hypothetical protein
MNFPQSMLWWIRFNIGSEEGALAFVVLGPEGLTPILAR